VLSWCATETPADYENAIKHWKQYSGYLGFMKPKPAQYYPCWLYLGLSRVGKGTAAPGTQTQEFTLAGREINFVLGTMADADRTRPLDDSFDDLMTYAATLGVGEKPKTLGEFFDVVLRKVGGTAPAGAAAATR